MRPCAIHQTLDRQDVASRRLWFFCFMGLVSALLFWPITVAHTAPSSPRLVLAAGHAGPVNAVIMHPSGGWFVTGGADGQVLVWSKARVVRRALLGHRASVTGLSLDPLGRWLASASEDSTVRLWDLHTWRLVRTMRHAKPVRTVAFAPNGRVLAAGGEDKRVTLWDPRTGARIRTLRGHRASVMTVRVDPRGRRLASMDEDGRLILWRLPSGRRLQSRRVSKDYQLTSYPVSFDHRGRRFATGDQNAMVQVWRTGRLRRLRRFHPPLKRTDDTPDRVALDAQDSVVSLLYGPRGKRLYMGDTGGLIHVWRSAGRRYLGSIEAHMNDVQDLALDGTGSRLVSVSAAGKVAVWNTATRKVVGLGEDTFDVKSLSFGPKGKRLAWVTQDDRVVLWNLFAANSAPRVNSLQDPVLAAHIRFDGKLLVCTKKGRNEVAVSTLAGRRGAATYRVAGWLRGLAFSSSGTLLALSSDQGRVLIGTTGARRVMKRLAHPPRNVTVSVAFDSTGHTLAATGYETSQLGSAIRVWDVRKGRLLRVVRRTKGYVPETVALHPKGELVAEASGDRSIWVWRVRDGALRFVLKGHRGTVSRLAFHPNGSLLASADQSGQVRLWNLATGRVHRILSGHRGPVTALAFSRTGLLATGGADDIVRLWDLRSGVLLALLALDDHGGWAVGNPAGQVDANPKGRWLVQWDHGGELRPASHAWKRSHVPGLLARTLRRRGARR